MRILVFDTETTWFINKKEPENLALQPYMTQFAWIYWTVKDDWEFVEEWRINELVKPPVSIPYWASKVTNIYDIDVKDKPPVSVFIDDFLKVLNDVDFCIWHNIEYDEWVINYELKRLNKFGEFKPKWVFCTMQTTVDFCAIRWNWERFKYPKLWELHKKLFWEYFMWAHDAMVDVEATLRCFLELNKKQIVKFEKPKEQIQSLF